MSCNCYCHAPHKPVVFEPRVGSLVRLKVTEDKGDDYLYVVCNIRKVPDTREAVRGCPFGTFVGEGAHKEYDLLLLKHGGFRTVRQSEMRLIPHDNANPACDAWTYQAVYRGADGEERIYETWKSGLPTEVEAKRFFGVWVQHCAPFVWANRTWEEVGPRRTWIGY